MNILHIVDTIDLVNYGIWQAAISTAPHLAERERISWLVFPATSEIPELPAIHPLPVDDISADHLQDWIKAYDFTPQNTVVVTHGCWRFPTRWGYALKKLGFKWIYTPQGMLEPWSMSQKRLKKWLYFYLLEYCYSRLADVVRAVSKPEAERLSKQYQRVTWIPNGVQPIEVAPKIHGEQKIFLFMARLHKKKGILPLVQAWKQVKWEGHQAELWIAGPDDGELSELLSQIKGEHTIFYKGAVYGEEKQQLLDKAHFYVLPSYSEGFPTSVVEAMSYGLIPLVSEGCNFPEVFSEKLGYQIEPDPNSITDGLIWASYLALEEKNQLSLQNSKYIAEYYSLSHIANEQLKIYEKLLIVL